MKGKIYIRFHTYGILIAALVLLVFQTLTSSFLHDDSTWKDDEVFTMEIQKRKNSKPVGLDLDFLHENETDAFFNKLNRKRNSLSTHLFNETIEYQKLHEKKEDDRTYLTMYGDHRVKSSIAALPTWLQEYITWNQNERATKDVKDTRFYVVKCLKSEGGCGGVSDRMRVLPFHLFMAARTNRVLCIHWDKPMRLESFLEVPDGGLDWKCPSDFEGRKSLGMNPGVPGETKPIFFPALNKFINEMKLSSERYVGLFGIRSKQKMNFLNNIFNVHSYKNQMPVASEWFHLDLMEHIFRVLFKPIPSIARNINTTMARLNLIEGEYKSVHLRARYPTYRMKQIVGKENLHDYDEGRYVEAFDGNYKSHLLDLTSNAFECGLLLDMKNPFFFVSDSIDLVNHVLNNEITVKETKVQALGVGQRSVVKHIDEFNASSTEESYYPLFEDLLIIGGSKCVVHGIGSFGAFGAALAGNRCRALHRDLYGRPLECPNNHTVPRYVDVSNNEWMLEQNESKSVE
ncbi:hypothetical protein CTEN210_16058 [Chaetoceros tenuissimus]|uniref:Uncharacterized protein n=1 Tax=Chaetoceros tenuissimus TaxID=426638 RepID=A0AAD3HD88_9STRA|nr:hypothetical protein CTEN210_16058 [Chaetoceros tenuissimus]